MWRYFKLLNQNEIRLEHSTNINQKSYHNFRLRFELRSNFFLSYFLGYAWYQLQFFTMGATCWAFIGATFQAQRGLTLIDCRLAADFLFYRMGRGAGLSLTQSNLHLVLVLLPKSCQVISN